MNGPRKFLLIVASILTFSPLMFSSATNIYITQDGSSKGACTAGPHNAAWFNSSSNWGGGTSQIGPGTTVLLCGTITSELTVGGSGSNGSSITILFDQNAMISLPACDNTNGCLNLNGKSYIIVDGGTPCGPGTACATSVNEYGLGTPATGAILQTSNGTPAASVSSISCSSNTVTVTGPSPFGFSLPNEPQVTISGNSDTAYNGTWTVASNNDAKNSFTFNAPCSGSGSGGTAAVLCRSGSPCSKQQGAIMIYGQNGCSNCEIRNIILGPQYQRVSLQDVTGLGQAYSVYLNGCSGCTTKIHDTTQLGAGIAYIPISSGDNGLQIYNNYLVGGGDSIVIAGSTSSNNLSGAQIHDNYIADNAVWDTPDCRYHLDGIHVWGLNGATESNINFYNNWITGNFGNCQTGSVFFEGNNRNDNFYNNVITTTYTQNNNGIIDINGPGPFLILDNTFVGDYQNGDVCFGVGSPSGSPSITFENNVVGNCHTNFLLQNSPTLVAWDYNAYGVGGWADPGPPWYGDLSQWQSACGCDNHSLFYTSESGLGVDSNGAPQSGSPLMTAGLNLGGLGLAALGWDTSAGDTRPPSQRPSGQWTIGAYGDDSGSPAPAPPTGLTVQVQ